MTKTKVSLPEETGIKRKAMTSGSKDAAVKGPRRSTRQRDRIPTSELRRLRQLFWDGDNRYDKDAGQKKDGTSTPRKRLRRSMTTTTTTTTSKLPSLPLPPLSLGRRWKLQKVHDSPHIYVLDDFLTLAELQYYEQLIQTTKFQKSFVDDHSSTTLEDSEHRTSTFVSLQKYQTAQVASVERRAAELLNLPSVAQIEPLQLVRYQPNQFFGVHHDMGAYNEEECTVELPPKQAYCKRRLVTLFCYLNSLPEACGGCTCFPLLNGKKGLRVHPKRGRAVLFCNVDRDGMPDERTVHAGEPVILCNDEEEAKSSSKKKDKVSTKPHGSKHNKEVIKYGLNIWACEE